ncbi:MAG: glycosyltransferase family 9 protein [Elusimicrobia bacterium]|nr:glycosyltransferase family 9 protein [Elusimicrobiota bacterium]
MPERIVLVLSAGIGDLFLAVPALRAIRRRYSNAIIWLVSSGKAASYAAVCSGADRVLAVPDKLGLETLRLLWELRSFRPDLAVNLYEISTPRGDSRMKMLFRIMSPKLSCGRRGPNFGAFFDKYVLENPGDAKTQGDYYADLARMIGAEVSPLDMHDLCIGAKAEKAAEELLSGRAGAGPLVGLNPASARRSRHWLPERFAELGDRLAAERACDIVILGGPGDLELARAVAVRMKRTPLVSAGKLSIEGSLALMRRLELIVTVHSSMMHAANILETPYVCLAGPGNMVKDGPYGGDPALRVILPASRNCAPCDLDLCPDHGCMKDLSVETVYEAALSLLGKKTR